MGRYTTLFAASRARWGFLATRDSRPRTTREEVSGKKCFVAIVKFCGSFAFDVEDVGSGRFSVKIARVSQRRSRKGRRMTEMGSFLLT